MSSSICFSSTSTHLQLPRWQHSPPPTRRKVKRVVSVLSQKATAKPKTALEYRKLGDSDLVVSEITFGTVIITCLFVCFFVIFYFEFWILGLDSENVLTREEFVHPDDFRGAKFGGRSSRDAEFCLRKRD